MSGVLGMLAAADLRFGIQPFEMRICWPSLVVNCLSQSVAISSSDLRMHPRLGALSAGFGSSFLLRSAGDASLLRDDPNRGASGKRRRLDRCLLIGRVGQPGSPFRVKRAKGHAQFARHQQGRRTEDDDVVHPSNLECGVFRQGREGMAGGGREDTFAEDEGALGITDGAGGFLSSLMASSL